MSRQKKDPNNLRDSLDSKKPKVTTKQVTTKQARQPNLEDALRFVDRVEMQVPRRRNTNIYSALFDVCHIQAKKEAHITP